MPADFTSDDPQLRFIHRRDGDAEIYFISNQRGRETLARCSFRVNGLVPELWHPEDGRRETAALHSTRDGVTTLPLHLEPTGSVFVVFRRPTTLVDPIVSVRRSQQVGSEPSVFPTEAASAEIPPMLTEQGVVMTAWRTGTYVATTGSGRTRNVATGEIPGPLELVDSWQVDFRSGRGAPPSAILARLVTWTDSKEDGIRYFSGTATYRKTFSLDGGYRGGGWAHLSRSRRRKEYRRGFR